MRLIVRIGIFSLLLLMAAPPVLADVQTFEILSDVEGSSPQDARDKALEYAKKRGFFLMLSKLAPEKAENIARALTTEQIYQYVRGYELLQDRGEANHYTAQYRISVSEDLVKRLISGDEKPKPLEVNPVLMLPVLDDRGHKMLWEGGNLWRSVWNKVALEKGENILVMPYGDPNDLKLIDSSTVLTYGFDYLQPMAARYGASEIVVALARIDNDKKPIQLRVKLRRLGAKLDKIKDEQYEGDDKESIEAVMTRAAKTIADQIKEVAKEYQGEQQRIILQANKQKLQAKFRRLSDWVDMQARLSKLPRVVLMEVGVINILSAEMTLYYNGPEDMMMKIIQANGFSVEKVGDHWVISVN